MVHNHPHIWPWVKTPCPSEHPNPTTKIGNLKWVVNSPIPTKMGSQNGSKPHGRILHKVATRLGVLGSPHELQALGFLLVQLQTPQALGHRAHLRHGGLVPRFGYESNQTTNQTAGFFVFVSIYRFPFWVPAIKPPPISRVFFFETPTQTDSPYLSDTLFTPFAQLLDTFSHFLTPFWRNVQRLLKHLETSPCPQLRRIMVRFCGCSDYQFCSVSASIFPATIVPFLEVVQANSLSRTRDLVRRLDFGLDLGRVGMLKSSIRIALGWLEGWLVVRSA